MTSVIGSGLSAQIGFAAEETYGTAVSPARFHRFTSETLAAKKKITQVNAIQAGLMYPRGAGRFTTQRSASGGFQMPVPTVGFGLLLQHMLGSFDTTPTQVGSSAAYQQIHLPASFTGHSLTIQKGVPRTDAVVEVFSYPGAKITGWTLDMQQSDVLNLQATVEAQDELSSATTPASPSLATATYAAGESYFSFTGGQILSGGTVTTSDGVTSISGATAVAQIRSAQVKGANPSDETRYALGNGPLHGEPIQNALSALTGQIMSEFTSRALYDQYRSDESTALQLNFQGPLIAGSNYFELSILLPQVFLEDGASPQVPGPELITNTIPFTATSDDTNPVVQVTYTSTDTAI